MQTITYDFKNAITEKPTLIKFNWDSTEQRVKLISSTYDGQNLPIKNENSKELINLINTVQKNWRDGVNLGDIPYTKQVNVTVINKKNSRISKMFTPSNRKFIIGQNAHTVNKAIQYFNKIITSPPKQK